MATETPDSSNPSLLMAWEPATDPRVNLVLVLVEAGNPLSSYYLKEIAGVEKILGTLLLTQKDYNIISAQLVTQPDDQPFAEFLETYVDSPNHRISGHTINTLDFRTQVDTLRVYWMAGLKPEVRAS